MESKDRPNGITKKEVIEKAQIKKFGQNEEQRKRLIETKGILYEATRDEEFGLG